MSAYRTHPLADLFPAMPPAEYDALLDSIRANGQREPITLHRDGRILDGRHRERACEELGRPVAVGRSTATTARRWPMCSIST